MQDSVHLSSMEPSKKACLATTVKAFDKRQHLHSFIFCRLPLPLPAASWLNKQTKAIKMLDLMTCRSHKGAANPLPRSRRWSKKQGWERTLSANEPIREGLLPFPFSSSPSRFSLNFFKMPYLFYAGLSGLGGLAGCVGMKVSNQRNLSKIGSLRTISNTLLPLFSGLYSVLTNQAKAQRSIQPTIYHHFSAVWSHTCLIFWRLPLSFRHMIWQRLKDTSHQLGWISMQLDAR